MVLGKTEEEGFAELDLAIFSRNVTCDMLCRLKDGNGLHPILQNYVSNIDYPQEPFVHYLSNVITPNGYWYSDDSFLFATEEQNDSTNNMNTSIWTHPIPCLNNETTSDSSEKNDHEKPLITFKSDYSEGWASFTLCTRRKDNTINNSNNNNEVSIQENKQNIESKEDESSFYNNIEQDISSTNLQGKFPLDNCPLDKIPLDNSQNELYPTKDKELLAVTLSLNRISVPNLPHGKLVHQISFNRILSNDTTELKTEEKIPVNVLEVDGVVIGATIDTKHEFLYLNIRNFDKSNDNVNTPRRRYGQEVHEEIQIRRIDLQTLEFEPGVMIIGHKGFTRKIFNGIFRLDIDLSENYISSGSEDSNGYIWDKHYKFLVAKLPHTKCVSCVAFNPIDEETCVSASDDNTLKVWRSSRKQREVHLSSKK
jgi:WD40 repeat protein